MSVDITDLKPKNFKIKVKGVELESKPLRLSHALSVSRIGNIFQNPERATKEQIKQAEVDMDELIGELIPELKGVELDLSSTLDLITQLVEHVQPADNKELNDKGVQFNTDPKV